MDKIAATVSKTTEVEMRPYLAFLYFDDQGSRRVAIQYGEYHDGILHRALAMQNAPEGQATPVLDAVYGAMQAAALAAKNSALEKAPEDRDANEAYLAALMEAGQ